MGRAGPAGHLDHRLRDPAGAARPLRRPGVPDRRAAGRAGPGAGAHHLPGHPVRRARQRAGRGRRLQRGDLPVAQVHGPADVADHRSAQRSDPAADARGAGAARRHPRVPARAAAGHRGLPRRPAVLRGRDVRPAVAAPERAAAVLSGDGRRGGRVVQPLRRSGGSRPRRAVHVGQAARLRGGGRVLPADRAVARDGVDLLRHRAGAGLAAGHSGDRPTAPAAARPAVVGRFARPLGGRHAGGRRHQLLSEDRLPGLAGEPAPGGALAPRRLRDAGVHRHDERSDDVDGALDRRAGAEPAERPAQPHLQGAPLPRGQLRPAGAAERRARRGAGVRRGHRPGSGHAVQRRVRRVRRGVRRLGRRGQSAAAGDQRPRAAPRNGGGPRVEGWLGGERGRGARIDAGGSA